MKCKNCGFISRGKETYCPYCNEPLIELSFLEKRINLFGWLYISVRSLLFLIFGNIFIISFIAELIINSIASFQVHFSPYVFFNLMILLLIFDNFLVIKSSKRWCFWKVNAIIILTSLLLALSFKGGQFYNFEISIWQFLIGYFLPISFAVIIFVSVIYYFVSKKFDIVVMFTGTLFIMFISSLIFGLSFLRVLDIRNLPAARLICDISFGFIMFTSFNSILLNALRLKNKVYRKV